MSHHLVHFENVSKKFCSSLKRTLLYGLTDASASMLNLPVNRKNLRKDEFWALRDINFSVDPDASLGIVGFNGAGKSTLLRLLTGIYAPSVGRISMAGRIGALIGAGAGFHSHMTGRENIYLNGSLMGMKRREIERALLDIIDFAEIGAFIDAPVATYSSGMVVRLGFAIAIHAPIDVLVADEVLAVGDIRFRNKCYQKIGDLRKEGVSIIMVNHSTEMIAANCNKILWLDKGKQKYFGDVAKGVELYQKFVNSDVQVQKKNDKPTTEQILITTEGFELTGIGTQGSIEAQVFQVLAGDPFTLNIYFDTSKDFADSEVEVVLNPPFGSGSFVFYNSRLAGHHIDIHTGKGFISIQIGNLPFNNIRCNLDISIWSQNRIHKLAHHAGSTILVEQKGINPGWGYLPVQSMVHQEQE
jgi:lipopolysaccharide transport system ATP-binding protein